MDQIKSPLAARNIPTGLKSCVIHGYGSWHEAIAQGLHDFFTRLVPKLKEKGFATYLVEGGSRSGRALLAEDHFHIIVGGPAIYGPTILCQPSETETPSARYLSTEQMIATAANYDRDALVYVKPHPHQTKQGRRQILEICENHPNVKLSDASIHDLIEAARVVITQNSSAGFEALMQKKPVITCGKTDYWHATLTPRTVPDLKAAIEFGPETMAEFDYEGYFHWFLERQCLEPAKDNFAARAWARIKDKLMLN
ncbi:capsular polysaccharide export protein, LipB/KpsS family [Celeribacter naphthalenivorans]|uniref:capsular polysaccharide export protein, LipB/KpsS family n=1 Tax=Celeribacter naphthalenivorans TaxID=1614694 RepID=UPI001CFAE44A|nr:hypothetical protein [Celeribacter naphthalenivorans]